MSTVQLCAPTHKATIQIHQLTATPSDSLDFHVGLPYLADRQGARNHGYTLGLEGIEAFTEDCDLDLVEDLLEGHRLGMAERVHRAQIAAADEPAEVLELTRTCDEGVASWALLPTSKQLSEGLRELAGRIQGVDPASVFARRLLDSVAGDVALFDARTFAEWDGRMNEMAATWGQA